ncbi:MAG: Uma2 family endonuclease, partial [Hyphomicrobiaceae bacterium]
LRVPDLGITCTPIDRGEFALPDPIVPIEVLSPGNSAETWENVWTYPTIPTVREIVVVHSTRVKAEVLRKGTDGTWPEEAEVVEPGGTLRIAAIDAAWPIEDIYAGTYLAYRERT